MTFVYSLIAGLFGCLLFAMYMLIRNERVHEFRTLVVELEYLLNKKLIEDGKYKDEWYSIYKSMPDYDSMVIRFWEPIKMETYLKEDDIQTLLSQLEEE